MPIRRRALEGIKHPLEDVIHGVFAVHAAAPTAPTAGAHRRPRRRPRTLRGHGRAECGRWPATPASSAPPTRDAFATGATRAPRLLAAVREYETILGVVSAVDGLTLLEVAERVLQTRPAPGSLCA